MLVQDKILNFLKATGPTLPSRVAKNLGTEIYLASAHLSDLASQGKIKISKLKVGGSPLYFLPGQEEQLFSYAADNMNPKNFQVLERLKTEKILRESTLDLLPKVALRDLKDFAVPLNVNFKGKTELFWKWHMLSGEETNGLIRNLLQPSAENSVNKQEAATTITQPEPISEVENEELPDVETQSQEPKAEPTQEPKSEVQQTIEPQPQVKKEPTTETSESTPEEKAGKKRPELETLVEKKAKKKTKKSGEETFFPEIEKFFKKIEVNIKEKEIVRKNSEINLLIKVPTVLGEMTYYCKAKNKNKCDEKDISAAYMEAQIKKLPLLFIFPKELTKKAKDMLKSDAFQNALTKKIE